MDENYFELNFPSCQICWMPYRSITWPVNFNLDNNLLLVRLSDCDESDFELCLHLLPEDEQERINKLYRVQDRNRSILAHVLLRSMIYHYNRTINGINFEDEYRSKNVPRDEFNRPDTRSVASGLDCNIAHDGDWILIGTSKDSRVGVDIMSWERCLDRSTGTFSEEFVANVAHAFSYLDHQVLDMNGSSTSTILDITLEQGLGSHVKSNTPRYLFGWIVKEALLKCFGVGLLQHPACVSLLDCSTNGLKFHIKLDMKHQTILSTTITMAQTSSVIVLLPSVDSDSSQSSHNFPSVACAACLCLHKETDLEKVSTPSITYIDGASLIKEWLQK